MVNLKSAESITPFCEGVRTRFAGTPCALSVTALSGRGDGCDGAKGPKRDALFFSDDRVRLAGGGGDTGKSVGHSSAEDWRKVRFRTSWTVFRVSAPCRELAFAARRDAVEETISQYSDTGCSACWRRVSGIPGNYCNHW